MNRTLTEHDRRALANKVKPLDDPDALAAFALSHWFCQLCGLEGQHSVHHIIGGRGGRSDEPVNLLFACWIPCHSQFADHSRNLPAILTAKIRAGELDEAGMTRLALLHGRTLPEPGPIPQTFEESFRKHRGLVRVESVNGDVAYVPESEAPGW